MSGSPVSHRQDTAVVTNENISLIIFNLKVKKHLLLFFYIFHIFSIFSNVFNQKMSFKKMFFFI
jgi:hypothetical protein